MNFMWLLLWSAFFIAGSVNQFSLGNAGAATFLLILGLGIGFHLIVKYMKKLLKAGD